MSKRCGGFSLIELMVALVIGLIISLGAGQLFMSVFQTNRQVATLSEKQAAVNFATETLLRDIRRAQWGGSSWDDGDGILTLTVRNRGDVSVSADCGVGDEVVKKYQLKDRDVAGNTEWFMAVEIAKCKNKEVGGGLQELVGGFISPDPDVDTPEPGFDVDVTNWNNGILQVTFRLVPTDDDATPDTLTFFAINRTAAVNDN